MFINGTFSRTFFLSLVCHDISQALFRSYIGKTGYPVIRINHLLGLYEVRRHIVPFDANQTPGTLYQKRIVRVTRADAQADLWTS